MAEFSWLKALSFGFLTFNYGIAICRSNGDRSSILFVTVSCLYLVILFYCLRYYERLDRHDPRRGKVKAAVWALTTMLMLVFSYKIPGIMPSAVKAAVWAMATATTCGGFYAFLTYEKNSSAENRLIGNSIMTTLKITARLQVGSTD